MSVQWVYHPNKEAEQGQAIASASGSDIKLGLNSTISEASCDRYRRLRTVTRPFLVPSEEFHPVSARQGWGSGGPAVPPDRVALIARSPASISSAVRLASSSGRTSMLQTNRHRCAPSGTICADAL